MNSKQTTLVDILEFISIFTGKHSYYSLQIAILLSAIIILSRAVSCSCFYKILQVMYYLLLLLCIF
jgi:hypothetical protein